MPEPGGRPCTGAPSRSFRQLGGCPSPQENAPRHAGAERRGGLLVDGDRRSGQLVRNPMQPAPVTSSGARTCGASTCTSVDRQVARSTAASVTFRDGLVGSSLRAIAAGYPRRGVRGSGAALISVPNVDLWWLVATWTIHPLNHHFRRGVKSSALLSVDSSHHRCGGTVGA